MSKKKGPKKETRGRPAKKHQPLKQSFGKVLESLADSEHREEKEIKRRKKK